MKRTAGILATVLIGGLVGWSLRGWEVPPRSAAVPLSVGLKAAAAIPVAPAPAPAPTPAPEVTAANPPSAVPSISTPQAPPSEEEKLRAGILDAARTMGDILVKAASGSEVPEAGDQEKGMRLQMQFWGAMRILDGNSKWIRGDLAVEVLESQLDALLPAGLKLEEAQKAALREAYLARARELAMNGIPEEEIAFPLKFNPVEAGVQGASPTWSGEILEQVQLGLTGDLHRILTAGQAGRVSALKLYLGWAKSMPPVMLDLLPEDAP